MVVVLSMCPVPHHARPPAHARSTHKHSLPHAHAPTQKPAAYHLLMAMADAAFHREMQVAPEHAALKTALTLEMIVQE